MDNHAEARTTPTRRPRRNRARWVGTALAGALVASSLCASAGIGYHQGHADGYSQGHYDGWGEGSGVVDAMAWPTTNGSSVLLASFGGQMFAAPDAPGQYDPATCELRSKGEHSAWSCGEWELLPITQVNVADLPAGILTLSPTRDTVRVWSAP